MSAEEATVTEVPRTRAAEGAAERWAAEKAQAERHRQEEAERYAEEREAAWREECEALGQAERARQAAADHRWRAARPSDLWPLASLEALSAESDAIGHEARAQAARERRRSAAWNLERLSRPVSHSR